MPTTDENDSDSRAVMSGDEEYQDQRCQCQIYEDCPKCRDTKNQGAQPSSPPESGEPKASGGQSSDPQKLWHLCPQCKRRSVRDGICLVCQEGKNTGEAPPSGEVIARRYRVTVQVIVTAGDPTEARLAVEDSVLVGEVIGSAVLPLDVVPIVVEHRRDREVGEWDPAVVEKAARYGVTMPLWRKSSPPWRVIPEDEESQGEVEGLPGLRGKVILTNGVMAILVREDGRWTDIHLASFKGDLSEEIRALVKNRTTATARKSPTQKALELYA